jgi:hypothetical protein
VRCNLRALWGEPVSSWAWRLRDARILTSFAVVVLPPAIEPRGEGYAEFLACVLDSQQTSCRICGGIYPDAPSTTIISIPYHDGRAVMMRGMARRSMGRRGIGLFAMVYLVIGLLVAGTHGYLVAWNVPGNILEALAAIVLWPLVAIFGVNLHALIA